MKHVFQFIMVIGPLIFSFSASCSWITKGHLSLPREFVNNLSQYQSEEIPQENLAYYAFWCAEVLVPRMQGFIIPNAALLPTSYAATCTKILTHADSLDFGRGNESFLINGSHIVSKELDDRINLALLNVFFNYFDYDTSDFREPAFDALHLSGDKQTGELSATVKAYTSLYLEPLLEFSPNLHHITPVGQWKWVHGSKFCFQIPQSFTDSGARGMDSEAAEFVDGEDLGLNVSYDFGRYTNNGPFFPEHLPDYSVAEKDNVKAYSYSEDGKRIIGFYVGESFFSRVGSLGIFIRFPQEHEQAGRNMAQLILRSVHTGLSCQLFK